MREIPRPGSLADQEEGAKALVYCLIVGGLVALDQITKYVVTQTLVLYSPVQLFGDYVRLTYIHNPGAAFGLYLGEHSRFIFLTLSAVAVVMLFLWYRTTPMSDRLRLVAISTVTGGALGNLIDRVHSRMGVIDFLDMGVGNFRWPVFNVADIAVTTGAALLAISLWKEEREIEARQKAAAEGRLPPE